MLLIESRQVTNRTNKGLKSFSAYIQYQLAYVLYQKAYEERKTTYDAVTIEEHLLIFSRVLK